MNEFRLKLTQKEIALATGLSQQYISLVIKGKRQPSTSSAEALEKATGVCREAWLWPKDHYNPYTPLISGKDCIICPRRERFFKFLLKKASGYLSSNPGPETLQEVSDITSVHTNDTANHLAVVWSYLDDDDIFRFIAGPRFVEPFFDVTGIVDGSDWPWGFSQLLDGHDIIERDVALKLKSIGAMKDLETIQKYEVKSMVLLTHKRRMAAIVGFRDSHFPFKERIEMNREFLSSPIFDKIMDNINK